MEEIQITKKIEKTTKRFLKDTRQFQRAKTYEEASAFLIFKISDLSRYHIIIKDDKIPLREEIEGLRIIFLKHSNPRDRRNATLSLIKHVTPTKNLFVS